MDISACGACAKPSATLKCARCKTAYCSKICQASDWKAGHKTLCKKITRAGGAEQYHADTKAEEAADAAIAACAEDLAEGDAQCYICRDGGPGLVRGCACRGSLGVAHVSCLVAQARVAHEYEEDNDLLRWGTCRLCGQRFYGPVALAMMRACWRTYVKEDEDDARRLNAPVMLGSALRQNGFLDEALITYKRSLATMCRLRPDSPNLNGILLNMKNLEREMHAQARASDRRRDGDWNSPTPSLAEADRAENCRVSRVLFEEATAQHGRESLSALTAALGLANALHNQSQLGQARSLLREQVKIAERVLGPETEMTLKLSSVLLLVLEDTNNFMLTAAEPVEADVREAEALTEHLRKSLVRVLGASHPHTKYLLFRIDGFAKLRRSIRDKPEIHEKWRREFREKCDEAMMTSSGYDIEATLEDLANARIE